MNNLQYYGWTPALQEQKEASEFKNFLHGRISVTHKTRYEVVSERGFFPAN